MAESAEPKRDESDLYEKLQDLTQGLGVRRTNLRTFLEDELCALWHIESTDPPIVVRAKVTAQLERLIAGLPDEERKLIARIGYNITGNKEVEGLELTARKEWLAREAKGPSASTSYPKLSAVIKEFEDSLRNKRPAPVSQEELEKVLGRALTDSSVQAPEPLPSPPPAPPRRSIWKSRISISVAAAVLVAVVAGLWTSNRHDKEASGPRYSPAATTGRSMPPISVPKGPTHAEVEAHRNGGVATWNDPRQPGQNGQAIPFMETVQVSCKVYSPVFGSVKWWYRIASSPWDNAWWAPANTFLNGDPLEGPYPHYEYDPAVPDC
jgi:hypothetical protein